jgi:hypothetical protein
MCVFRSWGGVKCKGGTFNQGLNTTFVFNSIYLYIGKFSCIEQASSVFALCRLCCQLLKFPLSSLAWMFLWLWTSCWRCAIWMYLCLWFLLLRHVVWLQLIFKLQAQVLFTFVRVRCFQTLSIAILAAQQLSFCFPSSLCALSWSKIFALLLCIFFKFTSPTFALFTNCSCMFLPSSSIIVKRCLQITLYFPNFI